MAFEFKKKESVRKAICEAAPQLEPDLHRERIDWIRTEDGDIGHPLQHRCFESSMKFWNRINDLGLREGVLNTMDEFRGRNG